MGKNGHRKCVLRYRRVGAREWLRRFAKRAQSDWSDKQKAHFADWMIRRADQKGEHSRG